MEAPLKGPEVLDYLTVVLDYLTVVLDYLIEVINELDGGVGLENFLHLIATELELHPYLIFALRSVRGDVVEDFVLRDLGTDRSGHEVLGCGLLFFVASLEGESDQLAHGFGFAGEHLLAGLVLPPLESFDLLSLGGIDWSSPDGLFVHGHVHGLTEGSVDGGQFGGDVLLAHGFAPASIY